jgi:DNA helicase HerA-like ATPase
MTPFLETLYRLNREAMHLFVDEADSIAPQKPFGEEARMLGAMEDVVRRGGIRGIGTTLITQRPAVINKNVLTQCEILCCPSHRSP